MLALGFFLQTTLVTICSVTYNEDRPSLDHGWLDNVDATMSTLFLNSPEYETVNSKKKFSCVYSTNNYFFSVCDVLPYLSKRGPVQNVLRMLFWVKRHSFLNSYKMFSFAACRRYVRGTPNFKCEPFTLLLTNLLVQTRYVTFTFVIYHSLSGARQPAPGGGSGIGWSGWHGFLLRSSDA